MARRVPSRRDYRLTGREANAFIEKFLRIPDGPYAGRPLILAPWQKQEIHRIYDGQVRRAIISTGKKNGKTGLCAALLLNHLVGPSARNHRNARLFSSAMSRDQAALTFDAARKMILWNPDLRQAIAIKESAKVLRNDELGIEYKALSSEAHRAQGLNPMLHIADELGEVVGPHSSLFEALELSTAAQRDVLTVVISTQAASDGDLLSTLIDDAIAGTDPRTIVSLYSAPKGRRPVRRGHDQAGQPELLHAHELGELLAMAAAARRLPARETAYRRYCLNQRIEMATPFVSPNVWGNLAMVRLPRSPSCQCSMLASIFRRSTISALLS